MVIITTRDTHRLATYSEKELGIGNIALGSFPVDAFGGEGLGKREEGGRSGWPVLQAPGVLGGYCSVPLTSSPGTALTWDFPPAPSTTRVTERAQEMTWILKKELKKLLQPRAIISCGDKGRVGHWVWVWGGRVRTKPSWPCKLDLGPKT